MKVSLDVTVPLSLEVTVEVGDSGMPERVMRLHVGNVPTCIVKPHEQPALVAVLQRIGEASLQSPHLDYPEITFKNFSHETSMLFVDD